MNRCFLRPVLSGYFRFLFWRGLSILRPFISVANQHYFNTYWTKAAHFSSRFSGRNHREPSRPKHPVPVFPDVSQEYVMRNRISVSSANLPGSISEDGEYGSFLLPTPGYQSLIFVVGSRLG